MKKKVGIMGGTFNPIHNGHLLLAENAREAYELDEVLFMPSGCSYMKDSSSVLDKRMRADMVSLALEGNPCFRLSLMEIEREGNTYTSDTLMELKALYPENQYYFLIGADNLVRIEHWRRPDVILQNCIIIAALRGNETAKSLQGAIDQLVRHYQADIRMLPARYIDLSSSEIRERLYSEKSVRYMLPEKVLEYIREKNLYRKGSRTV